MSTDIDARDLGKLAERLAKAMRERPDRVVDIMRKHGGIIEQKAAVLTPVDTGLLRRANTSRVVSGEGSATLTVENRMVYAPYQHNKPHRHTQPQARDHFISLPFFAELPALVDEIIRTDIEALQ